MWRQRCYKRLVELGCGPSSQNIKLCQEAGMSEDDCVDFVSTIGRDDMSTETIIAVRELYYAKYPSFMRVMAGLPA